MLAWYGAFPDSLASVPESLGLELEVFDDALYDIVD
mgnify:CR=1 FL=1